MADSALLDPRAGGKSGTAVYVAVDWINMILLTSSTQPYCTLFLAALCTTAVQMLVLYSTVVLAVVGIQNRQTAVDAHACDESKPAPHKVTSLLQ